MLMLQLKNGIVVLPNIVGDTAYSLRSWLMKAYRYRTANIFITTFINKNGYWTLIRKIERYMETSHKALRCQFEKHNTNNTNLFHFTQFMWKCNCYLNENIEINKIKWSWIAKILVKMVGHTANLSVMHYVIN